MQRAKSKEALLKHFEEVGAEMDAHGDWKTPGGSLLFCDPMFSYCGKEIDDNWEWLEEWLDDDTGKTIEEPISPVEEKPQEHTSSHYNFNYQLTPEDIERGFIKVDAYFVSALWGLFEQDGGSGILFHNLKTLIRYGKKKGNSKKRERTAMKVQIDNLERFE